MTISSSRGFFTFLADMAYCASSGILKAKQKLGVTFNSDKLGSIDFTKFSKLSMCSNISSVVEFQRWWVLKSKLFAQESTCSKESLIPTSLNHL